MVQANPATAAATAKLLIGDQPSDGPDTIVSAPQQVALLLSLLQPKSLVSIETQEGAMLSSQVAQNSDFWRHAYASLSENGTIQAWMSCADVEATRN